MAVNSLRVQWCGAQWCASLASDSVRLVAQIHDELLVECPCDHVLEVSRRTKVRTTKRCQ